jgi:hypothetical protein
MTITRIALSPNAQAQAPVSEVTADVAPNLDNAVARLRAWVADRGVQLDPGEAGVPIHYADVAAVLAALSKPIEPADNRQGEVERPAQVIYKVLRDWNVPGMYEVGDPSSPYSLVDLLSDPAPSDITTGEERMRDLAGDIASALSAPAWIAKVDTSPRYSAFQSTIEPARWYVADKQTNVAVLATEIGASGQSLVERVADLLNVHGVQS